MALPRKLKNFGVYNDGVSYIGQIPEVQLPKLARKLEDYRAGGMDGAVGVDMGQENLEMELTAGGFMRQVCGQFGSPKLEAVMLRFAGAYQQDDTCQMDVVEVYARGRWQEVDPGKAKPGDDTEFKMKARLNYYRLVVNGENVIEIDLLNMVFIANGVDLLAAQRRAIGLA